MPRAKGRAGETWQMSGSGLFQARSRWDSRFESEAGVFTIDQPVFVVLESKRLHDLVEHRVMLLDRAALAFTFEHDTDPWRHGRWMTRVGP